MSALSVFILLSAEVCRFFWSLDFIKATHSAKTLVRPSFDSTKRILPLLPPPSLKIGQKYIELVAVSLHIPPQFTLVFSAGFSGRLKVHTEFSYKQGFLQTVLKPSFKIITVSEKVIASLLSPLRGEHRKYRFSMLLFFFLTNWHHHQGSEPRWSIGKIKYKFPMCVQSRGRWREGHAVWAARNVQVQNKCPSKTQTWQEPLPLNFILSSMCKEM